MSDALGSSRIPNISSVIGENSFVGPTGPIGSTGATGESRNGPTGSRGKQITYVQGISRDTIRFILSTSVSEPATYLDVSGVQGFSGSGVIGDFSIGFTGITEDAVYAVQQADGLTLFFKSIQLIGEITGSYSSGNLRINETSSPFVGGLAPNVLVYIGVSLNSESSYNVLPAYGTLYTEKLISGVTYSSTDLIFSSFKESGNTRNFNIFFSDARNYLGVTIETNAAFYGRTLSAEDPTGFTYDFLHPFLKYGLSYANVNSVSGFTSGIIEFNKTQKFTKRIGSTTFIPLNEKIGSCCYCDARGERFCTDYMNRFYCEYEVGGNWNPVPCYARYSTPDCYPGGACCVNNKCVYTSRAKCIGMGGLFIIGETCSSISECPDRCGLTTGCCCVEGVPYTLTEELCAEISGSRFVAAPCGSVDCCKVGYLGACCKNKICYDSFSAVECGRTGGVFQGVGTVCASDIINCCTDPTEPANII